MVGVGHNVPVPARVIVLAGPSGAGKSRLADRLGLPVLRLDDFYKSGNDPSLPTIVAGANAGLTDWDHPESWHHDDALAALETLCRTGQADVPIYDIAHDGRCGSQHLDLGGSRYLLAEGIFAHLVVPECRRRGLLAAAYCVRQHPMVTFWRRLTRDLAERRKPPLVLIRRGVALLRQQSQVIASAEANGCVAVTPDQAFRQIRALVDPLPIDDAMPEPLRQPDQRSCGAAVVVVAMHLRDRKPAAELGRDRFAAEVLATHQALTRLADRRGRLQLPWPRFLGTPPWAIARDLASDRTTYRPTVIWPWQRRRLALRIERAVSAGHTVPLYVGNGLLPRHVTLVTHVSDDRWQVYEPSRGQIVEVRREAFVEADLRLGWDVPWFALLPTGR